MRAKTGDWLHIHGRHVGNPEKVGQILEVHGETGAPPYRVRFDDGHETIVYPGPDAVVEPEPEHTPGGGR